MSIFTVSSGLHNPHLQTLLPRVLRRRPLFEPFWKKLDTLDGDFLDLAWSSDPNDDVTVQRPLFILFHGLEGGFDSPYGHGLMAAFAKAGWLSVLMHFRGCSGRPNRKARSYHSGEITDVRFFLEWLDALFPNRKKIAVGVSLGGNVLIKYLAHFQQRPLLDAATVVSAPLDLKSCSCRVNTGFSKIYQRYLLTSLKKKTIAKLPLLKEFSGLTKTSVLQINTLYEFDDQVTAPLYGFNNADHYYESCSGLLALNELTIPTQVIQAEDDPFMTASVVPQYKLKELIDYRLFPHGGHVGFLSGTVWKPHFWLESYLPLYYGGLFDLGLEVS